MRTISDKLKTTIEIKEDQKKYLQEENPEVDLNTLPFKEYINLFKKTPIDNSHSEKGSNLSEKVNILSDTKNKQKEYLQQKYPNLDLNSIPFRSYLSLFKDEYIDGIIARYEAYDGSNEKEEALGLNAKHYLKDLTGHGHDIELFNFGWSEGSGYGKYGTDIRKWEINIKPELNTIENNILSIKYFNNKQVNFFYANKGTSLKMKVYCDGITEAKEKGLNEVFISSNKDATAKLYVFKDGLNDINLTLEESSVIYIWAQPNAVEITLSTPITIEQIPEYQGALISDGVDDYGVCENFPTLQNNKGFTVFAIRKYLEPVENWGISSLVNTVYSGYADASFVLENSTGNGKNNIAAFGESYILEAEKGMFTYLTSTSYNGLRISKGKLQSSSNPLVLFGFNSKYHGSQRKSALYSLEIYDHDLTPEEIEKVRERMLLKYYVNQGADKKWPLWFDETLVSWYDPKKQGLTNEEIAAAQTPEGKGYFTLKDHSINHLDAKAYGFAGEGMSGMDGYDVFDIKNKGVVKIGEYKYHIDGTQKPAYNRLLKDYSKSIDADIVISNADRPNILCRIASFSKDGVALKQEKFPKDGVYHYKLKNEQEFKTFLYTDWVDENDRPSFDLEFLPLYPSALVFDGVDDYTISEDQPILTDYTVMAKREIIQLEAYAAVASKNKKASTGAFIFETVFSNAKVYSFDANTNVKLEKGVISYQSKNNYNKNIITNGTGVDTDELYLGIMRPNLGGYMNMALYQFLLFNRTLTEEEMAWVRKNIMGEEEQPKQLNQ